MKNDQKMKSGLGRHPEARLFEQAQRGCEDNLDLLMERHKPLVKYAAKRQNLGDLPYDEAVQAGRLGLWKAILRFDPNKGYQFSTYAYPAIVHRIWQAVKVHCRDNRRAHATREWAVFFEHWEVGPAQRQREQEVQACLRTMVAGLPVRLKQVIIGRYGLDGSPPQILPELGAKLGVCGERVRQLQVEALVRLRHPAHSEELRALLRRHSQQEYEWAEELAQAWLRRRGGRNG
jgi:RNA polymerase sigma factor (sigma-70 family)